MNSYETQYYLFDIISNAMLALLIISYIGVWKLAPDYLEMLRMIVQIYISLFLIIRFNPYVKRATFSDLDRKVAYSAGIFVFMSTVVAKYITYTLTSTTSLKQTDTQIIANTII